ncbi:MAG: DUF5055 domain-containing protein [Bacteroidales bacterium]|nr:DUF5055 domain-containing protein [Bacteroidales bacterium]
MNAVERVPSIKFTDNDTGNVYELDFCRESVKFAEARGFKQEDIANYIVTKVPEFWFYAFRMHHKNMAKNQTDALLEKMGGLTPNITERLVDLYNQAATSNIIQDDEDLAKNARVTVEL